MPRKLKYTHMQLIALGFFLIILVGTILLMLPCATASGESAGLLNSLFTATSATCVTGLILQDTATFWSLFGQIVIIVLIQVGGLGFMTVATLFLALVRHRFGLRERLVMAESISTNQVGSIVGIVKMVLIGTGIIEGTGAVLLSIRFIPQFGLRRGIYYSIFHSISAFCNAGFDLMGVNEKYSSLVAYSDDALVSCTIMGLIVVGGLGFLVWRDLLQNGLHWKRYRLHTKLVLIVTAILIFGGALGFYITERNNLCVGMTEHEKILTSFFSSVTARTAGFNTVDTASLTSGSRLLTIILMFIGGSSGSTAGGIKTTTIAVLLLAWVFGLRGHQDSYTLGRKISDRTLRQAFLVFFTNLTLTLTGAFLIFVMQGLPFDEILFEAFSAIGTVGMSTGVTRLLSPLSCLIIIFLMFAGRVGSVSFVISLSDRRARPAITYPEENITVG